MIDRGLRKKLKSVYVTEMPQKAGFDDDGIGGVMLHG